MKYLNKEKLNILKKGIFIFQYIVSIAIIVYLFFWIKDFEMAYVKSYYLFIVILSIFFMRLTSIFRLKSLLFNFMKVSKIKMISSQLIGISLGLITPGKMGESYKILTLGHGKDDKKKLTLIFLFEKLMDTGVYVVFGLFFAFATKQYLKETIALLMLLLIAAVVYFKLNKYFSYKVTRFFTGKNVALSVVQFLMLVISFWVMMKGAGVNINFYSAAMIMTIASVVAIISTLPGGLGAREVTGTFLLSNITALDVSTAGSLFLTHTIVNYSTTWIITALFVFCLGNRKKN